MCANSKPALNDVTFSELGLLLEQAAILDKDLARALDESRLCVMDSGQASPCLDLGLVKLRHLFVNVQPMDKIRVFILFENFIFILMFCCQKNNARAMTSLAFIGSSGTFTRPGRSR